MTKRRNQNGLHSVSKENGQQALAEFQHIVKVCLTEEDIRTLVNGGEVKHGRVNIILSDIGDSVFIEILRDKILEGMKKTDEWLNGGVYDARK